MDWTDIIKTLLTVGGTIAVAWITYGLKKSSTQTNAEILDKLNKAEDMRIEQGKKLEDLQKKIEMQESANLVQQTHLTTIAKELNDNNLRTLRLDLLHAIESDPSNQLVILELASKYFVDMKGNCYMSRVFQEWADDHNVNITSIFNKG